MEVTIKDLKSGLHLGQMQVTNDKERSGTDSSRLQRSPPWRKRTHTADNAPSTATWQATL